MASVGRLKMARPLKNEYAVYRGDTFLTVGNIKECAEFMGVQQDTVRYYLSAAYKRKVANRKKSSGDVMIVIKLDDEECQ
jgi:hypothetical protein